MELKVVGKNVEITDSLHEYLDKKMSKLTRHLSNIDEAKVEIHEVKAKSPDQHVIVQATLKIKGTLLRGEEKASTINVAVDAVIKVLERQIERFRGKFDKKGRDSVRELKLEIAPEAS